MLPPSDADGKKLKCHWTAQDKERLVDFLLSNKAMLGEQGAKKKLWVDTAAELRKHPSIGAPKTAEACSTKWNCVSLPKWPQKYH
jgi:hypothetical protein